MSKKNKSKNKNKKRKGSATMTILAGTAGGVLASALGHLMADGLEQYLNKGGKTRLSELMHGFTTRNGGKNGSADKAATRRGSTRAGSTRSETGAAGKTRRRSRTKRRAA